MKVSKILVAVSQQETLSELLWWTANLCAIKNGNKTKIYALYVIEMPRSLPLDANIPEETEIAEEILSLAEKIAEEEYSLEINTDILQARAAGPAILEKAEEIETDVILIGATSKTSLEEKFFGSTADYILKRASCKVCVVRGAKEIT